MNKGALATKFSHSMLKLFGVCPPSKIGISLSGGVDSMALTKLAVDWAKPLNIKIVALTMDHGLRTNSVIEAEEVSEYVKSSFGIDSRVLKLSIDKSSPKVEEIARNKRREALRMECHKQGIGHILLGHHMNDQIELFIMRLLAGSGWNGLAGMKPSTYLNNQVTPFSDPLILVRPLLEIEKLALITFCETNKIKWWEDPTNADTTLTERNLIRKLYKVEPTLQTGTGEFAVPQLAKTIASFNERRSFIEHNTGAILACMATNKCYSTDHLGSVVKITDVLKRLKPALLKSVLFRLIIPHSPLKDDFIFKRKHTVKDVAWDVANLSSFKKNVLGVELRLEKGSLRIRRENMRAEAAKLDNQVYEAKREWSEWTLVDNRIWLRWRLPETTSETLETKFFSIQSLNDVTPVLELLKLTERQAKMLKTVSSCHPFLLFEEVDKMHTVNEKTLIGFPTLGIVKNMEVEWRPKTYVFENA